MKQFIQTDADISYYCVRQLGTSESRSIKMLKSITTIISFLVPHGRKFKFRDQNRMQTTNENKISSIKVY